MTALGFDIETNGLLDTCTKIHSLCIQDADTGKEYSCCDQQGYMSVNEGLSILACADMIIGHNIIKFDLPVIQKLHLDWTTKALIRDTLVCTRLIWPDITDSDYERIRAHKEFPARLIGRHSLEAWGYRIREYKGDFCKETDWQNWSKEMQEYCMQDVTVTLDLWNHIKAQKYSETAIDLEHDFQKILWTQEQNGFPFAKDRAVKLYSTLSARRETLSQELLTLFPPKIVQTEFTPKRDNKAKGWKAGVAVIREKEVPFNPASRQQIADRLIEQGWKPDDFTDTGHPVVDETALSSLHTPATDALCEYLMLQKRIGQLAEGNNAWLKLEKDGVIYGTVITNGAVTGRCTHSSPNMAQIPAIHSPYGKECRSLFGPPEGWMQVGCDASGLELRCLAHYMSAYDGGAYANVILTGDIHTENQKAAGLETRDQAKRFIYAFLYGAGDIKLGSVVSPQADEETQRKAGKQLKAKFFKKLPAFKQLITDVQNTAQKRGYLRGLDGRRLHIRSQHSALNTLLQSAGAIVMKKATCILWQDLNANGLYWPDDVIQMAHVHDEYQLATSPEHADLVGKIGIAAITKAGEFFNFKCPLAGEYKTGSNWADCH
jgi:DNA polymerase I